MVFASRVGLYLFLDCASGCEGNQFVSHVVVSAMFVSHVVTNAMLWQVMGCLLCCGVKTCCVEGVVAG